MFAGPSERQFSYQTDLEINHVERGAQRGEGAFLGHIASFFPLRTATVRQQHWCDVWRSNCIRHTCLKTLTGFGLAALV